MSQPKPGLSAADLADQQLVNNFQVPKWASKPPTGLHLDVLKEGKLVQKLMIDEKKCYFFGRNKQLCDFPIEHASSSRVHAALVWHGALERPFLIDLGSTHGTFIGEHIRLEPNKPQQIPPDSQIHFGASQRIYVVKERPYTSKIAAAVSSANASMSVNNNYVKSATSSLSVVMGGGSSLELPEDETELDNLTEYNTAHNRRIASLPLSDQKKPNPLKRRKFRSITFCEEEQVINPEDVDPNVGRFRNLCRTVVVPTKKQRTNSETSSGISQVPLQFFGPGATSNNRPSAAREEFNERNQHQGALHPEKSPSSALSVLQNPLYSSASKLFNIPMPNLAPSLDDEEPMKPIIPAASAPVTRAVDVTEDLYLGLDVEDVHGAAKHKVYAKEAWPGKKPTVPGLLV